MCYFNTFGKINSLISDNIKIGLTLERSMNKLFETKKKADSTDKLSDVVAKYKFTEAPYCEFNYIQPTSFWESYYTKTFNSINTYRYGIMDS